MKNITKEDVIETLVRAEILYRCEFKGFTISEQDEALEQLLPMRIFLAELDYKIREGKEFSVDFAQKKLNLLMEYLDDLENTVKLKTPEPKPEAEQDNPYAAYSIHSEE